MKTKEFNVLQNRSICMNNVHHFINLTVPKLIVELNKGFKLTNNHSLFKKDSERVLGIINSRLHVPPGNFPVLRAFLNIDAYSIWLEVDDNYAVRKHDDGGCTVNYYRKTAYIYDVSSKKPSSFEALKLVTTKQLEKAEIDLKQLEKDKDNIQDKIYEIQSLLM